MHAMDKQKDPKRYLKISSKKRRNSHEIIRRYVYDNMKPWKRVITTRCKLFN